MKQFALFIAVIAMALVVNVQDASAQYRGGFGGYGGGFGRGISISYGSGFRGGGFNRGFGGYGGGFNRGISYGYGRSYGGGFRRGCGY